MHRVPLHQQTQQGTIMAEAIWLLAASLFLIISTHASGASQSGKAIEHRKFLVGYGNCNDCHTPGWNENTGHAPKDLLLTGSGLNFQGP